MDNNINKNDSGERNKNTIWVVVMIVFVLVLFAGGTLAYFALNTSNNNITGSTGEVDLTLNVTKILPNTTGTDDIIVSGFNNLADNLNAGCLYTDGEYATCQLYQITLSNCNSNDCNTSTSVNTNVVGSVSFNNTNTPNLSWILVDNYSSSTTYTSDDLGTTFNTSSSEFVVFEDGYLLTTGNSVTYYMLVWVNEATETQSDNGEYGGTIKFEDENGKGGVTSTFSA